MLTSALVGVVQDVLLCWRHGVHDGVPIQRFLQDAFLNKWETVVRAVGDLDGVFRLEVRRLTLLLIYLLLTCIAGQMYVDNERAT